MPRLDMGYRIWVWICLDSCDSIQQPEATRVKVGVRKREGECQEHCCVHLKIMVAHLVLFQRGLLQKMLARDGNQQELEKLNGTLFFSPAGPFVENFENRACPFPIFGLATGKPLKTRLS